MGGDENIGEDMDAPNAHTSPALQRRYSSDSGDDIDGSKRRRLGCASDTQSESEMQSVTGTRASDKASEWRLELCSGSDETLQLQRFSSTASAQLGDAQSNENVLDSYRLETLATAERTTLADIDDADRWCDATISTQHVAITIGRQIHILSADCRKQEAVICHDGSIRATSMNCDSSFVAFGDETGTLFIVHIKTRRPVFSQAIKSSSSSSSGIAGSDAPTVGIVALQFTISESADAHTREELVVVTSDGMLVRFSSLRLCRLSQAILEGDMAMAAEIKGEIKVELAELSSSGRTIHAKGIGGISVTHSNGSSHVAVAGSGDACMSCWRRVERPEPGVEDDAIQQASVSTQLADIVSFECSGSGYVKIALSLDQRYLVALSKHGSLDVYERLTLTLVFRYTETLIDDFSLLAPGSAKAETFAPTSILLAAISKPVSLNSEHGVDNDNDEDRDEDDEDEDRCRRLLVISLPSMELIYSMDVSVWSWFAHDIRSSQDVADTILFIEGTYVDGTQTFFLRNLYETVPMERLSHFLRAGRYAEAEAFAEDNGISLAVVNRKRLEDVLSDPDHPSLVSVSCKEEADAFTDQALDLLDHIGDTSFAIDACIRLAVPSLQSTQRLLLHARALAESDAPSMAKVVDSIQRLGTWCTIGYGGTSRHSEGEFDVHAWQVFRAADLASCMRSYIARGDVERAGAIWRRHQGDRRLCSDVSSAIQGFPVDADTMSVAAWLEREVLPLFNTRQQWCDIAVWIEQRARVLEAKQAKLQDALRLLELLEPGRSKATAGSGESRTHVFEATTHAGGAGVLPGYLLASQPLAVTPQRFIEGSLQSAAWVAGLAQFSGIPVFSTAAGLERSSSSDTGMQSCLFLRKQLLDLVHLRDKHGIALALDEYEQMSYSMIAIEFLDRVAAPELLDKAYFAHFVPYAQRHQLDYAQILHKYCIDMMDSVDREDLQHARSQDATEEDSSTAALGMLGSAGRHTWEPRVIRILDCLYASCIGRDSQPPPAEDRASLGRAAALPLTAARLASLKTYFEIVLEVMRRSMIPWSLGIDSAIEKCLLLFGVYGDLEDDLGQCRLEVTEQHRLMCLKRMLLSYGLHDFHISNTRMAYPLLQWLVRKTDSSTIMSDVLQLVDAYHHLSRTSAYVLRLQALCEAGETAGVADLVRLIDATEHSSATDHFGQNHSGARNSHHSRQSAELPGLTRPEASGTSGSRAGQSIYRYVPMEVARRGICWIREVLDNMAFVGESSRSQFKQLVGAAMAMLRALEELARQYARRQLPFDGLAPSPDVEYSLAEPELRRLQRFVSKESLALGVVWQLIVDGDIMVSPGELEHQHAREQILAELIERRWLGPAAGHPAKAVATASAGKGKGKQQDARARPGDAASLAPGCELASLPPIPASIKALAVMLQFSAAQLWHQIVMCCLSLGLHAMALDMCQHIVGALKPTVAPTASGGGAGRAREALDEWPVALSALAACEREISVYLAGLSPSNSASGGNRPDLPGKRQGLLVRRLVGVCQAASLKCAGLPQLAGFLDAYSCWDLALSVFDQTTDGDFAILTRAPPAAPSVARPAARAFASGAVASSSAHGESRGMTSAIEDAMATADISGDHESALASWLGPLFVNAYVERGLVLDTGKTMHLVYRLASALRRLPAACAGSDSKSADADMNGAGSKGRPSLGKHEAQSQCDKLGDDAALSLLGAEDMRLVVIKRCGDLVAHLAANRHWILAAQALELTISQLARSSFVMSSISQPENTSESLGLLRQRLASGGISEDELAALFSGGGDAAVKGIQSLLAKSLVRSLQQRGADAVFIFSAMLVSDMVFGFNQLSTAMSHAGLLPSRVISLANIGMACSLLWKQHGLLDRCKSVAAAARWSDQLQLLQLKFEIEQLNNPKPELLEPLVRPMLIKTAMDITTVLEFADAFKLDETFVILEYISLCCSAPAVDGYQARIIGIADEIANTKLLERTFVDSMENAISAYDYERLQFVVQRLQDLRPQDDAIGKYSAVLDVLCSYDRKGKPTHEELLQEWSRTRIARNAIKQISNDDHCRHPQEQASCNGDKDATVPTYQELAAEFPLASKRLPFHYLVSSSPWLTLLPELSIDTVEALLPLAEPLSLSEDDFYINLIDSMLKQWKPSEGQGEQSEQALTAYEQAISKTPTHFNAVERLIRRCRDPEATISTIKHVADELPCGPNRIAALNFGLKVLNKWGQLIKRMPKPERGQVEAKANTIYMHFKKSLADANTEVVLRRNRLETYLSLFADAQDLDAAVRALAAVFEGECEGALCEAGQEEASTLHGILRNLAAIYEIGMDQLVRELLSRYLKAPVVFVGESSELQLPSIRYHATLRLYSSQEAVLHRRIAYLLRIQPMPDAITALVDFAYKNLAVDFLCRVRALVILLSIASSEDIAQVLPPADAHRFLQALLYTADFEHVGIRQSTTDFLSCDKAALARSVWIDYHEDAKVTLLVCNMCLDFRVDDSDLIARMLSQLLAAGMHRYVVGVLDIISGLECYMSISALPMFWNQATQGSLVQLTRSAEAGWIGDALMVLDLCARSIHLPLIDLSDVVRVLLQEARCNPDNSAPVLLAFASLDVLLPNADGEHLLRDYIEQMPPPQIHSLVLQLREFASVSMAAAGAHSSVSWEVSRGLTLIFDMIDSTGLHEQALLHPLMGAAVQAFVHNRIHHDKLLTAVNACIDRGKRRLAGQLVSRYYQTRAAEVLMADARQAGLYIGEDDTLPESPAATQDLTAAVQRAVGQLTEQQKLDMYISSHK